MRKLLLLAAAGVGYVLGSRAGRERYEQIKRAATRVKDDPRVQEKAHQAADFAAEKAPVVKDKVTDAAGTAASKVSGSASKDDADSALNPDRLKLGEDTGPQGNLP